jgi:hypothetical protein
MDAISTNFVVPSCIATLGSDLIERNRSQAEEVCCIAFSLR